MSNSSSDVSRYSSVSAIDGGRPKYRPNSRRLANHPRPQHTNRLSDVVQNTLLGHPLQLNNAPTRQVRKSVLDFVVDPGRRARAQRAEPRSESKLAPLGPDEIEHGQAVLFVVQPQTAAKLLKVDCQALGWAQEQERIDLRKIDTFVVQIDDE